MCAIALLYRLHLIDVGFYYAEVNLLIVSKQILLVLVSMMVVLFYCYRVHRLSLF